VSSSLSKQMTLSIRAAGQVDEEAVVSLWKKCGLVVRYNDPIADFRFARAKLNSDVLVGVDANGGIVGSVMVGHDGHRGWVYYVAAAERKQGIGRAMMHAAENWLTEHGVPKVQLMVRETNTQVVKFYERIGFDVIPRTVMQKSLKAAD
jgi:ribosomal protein S18 acetylase RimI-like enzyme